MPFNWRMCETRYAWRTSEQVEQWVFEAAADGASTISTDVGRNMCNRESADKVKAFIRAAKRVEALLAQGCPREELLAHAPGRGSGQKA